MNNKIPVIDARKAYVYQFKRLLQRKTIALPPHNNKWKDNRINELCRNIGSSKSQHCHYQGTEITWIWAI